MLLQRRVVTVVVVVLAATVANCTPFNEPRTEPTTTFTTTTTTNPTTTTTTNPTTTTTTNATTTTTIAVKPEQCPIGVEITVGGGRRVMVVVVVGGLGAAAARASCRAHTATPFFLNTQDDADLLFWLLKDCVKSGKVDSVWVPARRHTHHKKIDRPLSPPSPTHRPVNRPAHEYDWLSAHYDRASDTLALLPFPKRVMRRKGIVCVRRQGQQ